MQSLFSLSQPANLHLSRVLLVPSTFVPFSLPSAQPAANHWAQVWLTASALGNPAYCLQVPYQTREALLRDLIPATALTTGQPRISPSSHNTCLNQWHFTSCAHVVLPWLLPMPWGWHRRSLRNTAQASLLENSFPKPRLLMNYSQFSQMSYFFHKMCLYLENTNKNKPRYFYHMVVIESFGMCRMELESRCL